VMTSLSGITYNCSDNMPLGIESLTQNSTVTCLVTRGRHHSKQTNQHTEHWNLVSYTHHITPKLYHNAINVWLTQHMSVYICMLLLYLIRTASQDISLSGNNVLIVTPQKGRKCLYFVNCWISLFYHIYI